MNENENRNENVKSSRMKDYDDLDFTDDFMFCKVLKNNPQLCKKLAQVCTGEKFGDIVIHKQHEIEITLNGHGVRFDVCLEDEKIICDVEMQVVLKSNLPKRSRYYQGIVDVENLERGKDYQNLRKSYIIFICLENPFKEANLHKYTFVNICKEDKSLELGDDAIKIFLTPDSTADDISGELEELMNFVVKKQGNSDFTKGLEEAVAAIKRGDGWRWEYMHIKELYDDAHQTGEKKGRKEGRIEGIKEGRAEEREKGDRDLIEILAAAGVPKEEIIKNLVQKRGLSEEEAKNKVEKYYKN